MAEYTTVVTKYDRRGKLAVELENTSSGRKNEDGLFPRMTAGPRGQAGQKLKTGRKSLPAAHAVQRLLQYQLDTFSGVLLCAGKPS
jgi:hypothetical protein